MRRFLLLWLVLPLFGTTIAARPARADWGETYTLPNGLRVILSPDRRFPEVTVFVRYHVGARHEPLGRSGIAHLVEHLTFRIPRPSVKMGAYSAFFTVSSANGSTHFDNTDYYTTTPSADLKYALWKERWRMGLNLAHVDQYVHKQELDVVRNERRQRIEIAPYSAGRHRLWIELFPKSHPYHDEVIGSMEDLGRITLPEIESFLIAHYGPHNATLAVVGDFEPAAARQFIDEYYLPMQPREGARPPAASPAKPSDLQSPIVVDYSEPYGQNRRVHMAWQAPPAFTPDNAVGNVVAAMLGNLQRSRMMTHATNALYFSVFQESMLGGSVFHIVAEPKPGVDIEAMQRQVEMVLGFLRAQPPKADEIEHAVRRILAQRFALMEHTLDKAEFLTDLIVDGKSTGDPLAFEASRYRAVTPADVRRFADTYLTNAHRVILRSTPAVKK